MSCPVVGYAIDNFFGIIDPEHVFCTSHSCPGSIICAHRAIYMCIYIPHKYLYTYISEWICLEVNIGDAYKSNVGCGMPYTLGR